MTELHGHPAAPDDAESFLRHETLAGARKLVRGLAAAPDPRLRAQAVLSELRHEPRWSPAACCAIAATDAWLSDRPAADAIAPRLRALLAELA